MNGIQIYRYINNTDKTKVKKNRKQNRQLFLFILTIFFLVGCHTNPTTKSINKTVNVEGFPAEHDVNLTLPVENHSNTAYRYESEYH